jgi:hypothetical protein
MPGTGPDRSGQVDAGQVDADRQPNPSAEVLESSRAHWRAPEPLLRLLTRLSARLRPPVRRVTARLTGWIRRRHGWSRVRRGQRWVGWLLLGVAALAVAVQSNWTGQRGRPAHSSPAAHPAIGPDLTPVLVRQVQALANTPGPWRDYVRPDRSGGACPAGPVGFSPTAVVSAALAKAVPGFRVVDSARTFNQAPGLCSIAVRARDHAGTVTVLVVTPPSGAAVSGQLVRMSSDTRSDGVRMTTAVSAVTGRGWTVVVGSVGPVPAQPSIRQLFLIALDPTLSW